MNGNARNISKVIRNHAHSSNRMILWTLALISTEKENNFNLQTMTKYFEILGGISKYMRSYESM